MSGTGLAAKLRGIALAAQQKRSDEARIRAEREFGTLWSSFVAVVEAAAADGKLWAEFGWVDRGPTAYSLAAVDLFYACLAREGFTHAPWPDDGDITMLKIVWDEPATGDAVFDCSGVSTWKEEE